MVLKALNMKQLLERLRNVYYLEKRKKRRTYRKDFSTTWNRLNYPRTCRNEELTKTFETAIAR